MPTSHRRPARPAVSLVLLAIALGTAGCGRDDEGPPRREVVLYTSQDSAYLEGFLDGFEQATGIHVSILGDSEAAKTVGLAQRLLEERERPRADVFWNNEFANTLMLDSAGVLAAYDSPAAADLDEKWRDPERHWTSLAGRLRVIIVNTAKLGDRRAPSTWDEIVSDEWRDEGIVARPMAGTTLTHVASLLTRRGEAGARAILERMREMPLADGNGQVARQVAAGRYTWGLTDTDDLHLMQLEGKPVAAVFPTGDMTLVIPSTIALVAGAPHPAEARELIDHLLARETEARLAASAAAQLPLRADVTPPEAFGALANLAPGVAGVEELERIAAHLEPAGELIEEALRR